MKKETLKRERIVPIGAWGEAGPAADEVSPCLLLDASRRPDVQAAFAASTTSADSGKWRCESNVIPPDLQTIGALVLDVTYIPTNTRFTLVLDSIQFPDLLDVLKDSEKLVLIPVGVDGPGPVAATVFIDKTAVENYLYRVKNSIWCKPVIWVL